MLRPAVIGEEIDSPRYSADPWVSDHVLLNLSLWWVQNTRQPDSIDLPGEVGVVFRSLQEQLQ